MNNKLIDLRNIELYSVLIDLLDRLWIVFMVACIGIMGQYTFLTRNYVPEYTSSAIYVVTPRQSTGYVYTNRRFAESAVPVFQNLMNTDIMNKRIAEEINNGNVDARIRVELIEGTNLMKVSATSTDPLEAFEVIGAIMNNYDELSEYLNSDAVFDTLKAPVVAKFADNGLTPQNQSILAGIIAGLAVMLVIVMISCLRTTIKKESVVEDELEVSLIGTVYHEKKNRTIKARITQMVKALLITSPIISSKFIESINSICIKLEYEHERHPEKKVFMISSVCENEGKSTVALNIALSLAKEGKKIILIDADMRKPAIYKMLDIPKEEVVDMVKLFRGECGLDEVLYHDKNLDFNLIMSPRGHANTHEYMKSSAMKDLIQKCKAMADFVIVDTPPMSLVSDAEVLLDRVDFSILVIRQDFSYKKDIQNCINTMKDSGAKMLGSILNDYKVFRPERRSRENAYSNSGGKAVEIYDNE